ncbi:hypothetical protein PR003_g31368 [Phytophthora rubi]|uniref:Uncharacterized protein n=1 Tax=Phytophthora rubi TaxID=129364 RepID=A0A6A3HIQ0_9STRA|nr:hypothetical protein PR002_g27416 [Phytophthora rubi]KAE9268669.1 hypothetical protein PR003_g31368 [Phytophthora rubi]
MLYILAVVYFCLRILAEYRRRHTKGRCTDHCTFRSFKELPGSHGYPDHVVGICALRPYYP